MTTSISHQRHAVTKHYTAEINRKLHFSTTQTAPPDICQNPFVVFRPTKYVSRQPTKFHIPTTDRSKVYDLTDPLQDCGPARDKMRLVETGIPVTSPPNFISLRPFDPTGYLLERRRQGPGASYSLISLCLLSQARAELERRLAAQVSERTKAYPINTTFLFCSNV
jgi:hypothetical protein